MCFGVIVGVRLLFCGVRRLCTDFREDSSGMFLKSNYLAKSLAYTSKETKRTKKYVEGC